VSSAFVIFGTDHAAKRESLCARFAHFSPDPPPHHASAGASVEKIFDLGKTDTARCLARVCQILCDNFFCSRIWQIEFADCAKTLMP